MRSAIGIFVVLSAVTLSGCTSYPLPKLSYEKAANVTSNQVGSLTLTSGVTQGVSGTTVVPAGGIFVPVGGGNSPNWVNFNREDQAIFAESLREELNRLGIMKIAPTPAASPNIALKLTFARTMKNPGNDYILDVALDVQTPKETMTKRYQVRSFDGESGWATFNVTPVTGKKMAAQKLLNLMIPDIEAAVRAL